MDLQDQNRPPVEVVCAVLRRGGRLLVARRPAGKRLAGCWEFPGGKIEPGETAEAALLRELREELGCAARVLRRGPVILHEYPWCAVRMHSFECALEAGGGEPAALEHDEIAWIEPAELDRLELAPADVPLAPWARGLFEAG